MRKKSIISTIIILIFAIFSATLVVPDFFNRKIDRLEEATSFEINRRIKNIDFELGLDLQGGAHLLYQADLTGVEDGEKSNRMQALRDLIERRVDHFGIGEPIVQVRGERIVVELPGVTDQEEAIGQIGETPFLEFRIQRKEGELQKIEEKRREIESLENFDIWDSNFFQENIEDLDEETIDKIKEVEDWELAFVDEFVPTGEIFSENLTGRFLQGANIGFDQLSGEAMVSLRFDREGGKILHEITAESIGKPMATYLDEERIQVATIQDEIRGGQAQISGNLGVEEARQLARDLEIGALPVPIELISQRSVGPALGQRSLERSVKAGAIGFLAVIVFMIFYYKMLGLLAAASLIIYVILVLLSFKLLSVTLTLSGIAGFVLSIGMAIDANILIFSRMKEELSSGKDFIKAAEDGFSRAWPSIRDGNLTTILVALILFFVTTSFVQGFATVLIIGILISIFTSMVVTRSFIQSFVGSKLAEIKKLWL